VEDQGPIGSCTANAGCTQFEIKYRRLRDKYPEYGIKTPDFSRLYVYFWERDFEARRGEEGAWPNDMLEVLRVKGVCEEIFWPYDVSKENVQPPAECDKYAKAYKVFEYVSLQPALTIGDWPLTAKEFVNNIKHAVCQGIPVPISFSLTQDFQVQGSIIKDWKKFDWNNVASPTNLVVGFDDSVQRFLCQNSWGPNWCDGGFFGIPYTYFGDFNVITSGYATLKDTCGNIPVDGYIPKIYDAARAGAIASYMNGKIAEIAKDAAYYQVTGDEVDNAMKWQFGTAKGLFGI
jgi:hypothetical protein